jgi:hypothetical protein
MYAHKLSLNNKTNAMLCASTKETFVKNNVRSAMEKERREKKARDSKTTRPITGYPCGVRTQVQRTQIE